VGEDSGRDKRWRHPPPTFLEFLQKMWVRREEVETARLLFLLSPPHQLITFTSSLKKASRSSPMVRRENWSRMSMDVQNMIDRCFILRVKREERWTTKEEREITRDRACFALGHNKYEHFLRCRFVTKEEKRLMLLGVRTREREPEDREKREESREQRTKNREQRRGKCTWERQHIPTHIWGDSETSWIMILFSNFFVIFSCVNICQEEEWIWKKRKTVREREKEIQRRANQCARS
jgi:hypothetical protein